MGRFSTNSFAIDGGKCVRCSLKKRDCFPSYVGISSNQRGKGCGGIYTVLQQKSFTRRAVSGAKQRQLNQQQSTQKVLPLFHHTFHSTLL
mmetsp:Transcript_15194/g.43930  ORF Transcript_15194/g.43930 Transcript_15194/m.43930 type:complete len:90 (+) Transcript_15194:732-1001(+)